LDAVVGWLLIARLAGVLVRVGGRAITVRRAVA
jgi:hypothetical protein